MNTRIAPSPTGNFHLGTARTAYFNWLVAKATDGKFILRIDDTDSSREISCADAQISDSLDWLGLTPDLIFYQSDTFDRCREIAKKLIDYEFAYQDGQAVIFEPRLLLNITDSWYDEVVGHVNISENDKKIAIKIPLIKSNNTPTYMFASVVNDIDYNIDAIIRGVDHISNTFRQILIRSAIIGACNMDITTISYAHIGLVKLNNKKLSKRDNPPSVLEYRDQGYLPDAVLSFLLRQGWSHKDPNYNKPISKHEAVQMFLTEGKMNAKDSNLDFNKLNWMQRKLNANTKMHA